MLDVLYRPRLPNSKEAPINLFMRLNRWNIICWPLEDGVPFWIYLFDRLLWIFGFIVFLIHNDSEARYLRSNLDDIDKILTGVPTYLVLNELHLRAFSLGFRKTDLKNLLKKFYAEIYIEKSTNSEIFEQIERQMWPVRIFSFLYLWVVSLYFVKGVYVLATNKRELLYNMIPPFDYMNNFYLFFALLMTNIWVGYIVAVMIFGEGNVLAQLVFHLNGRYRMMRQSFSAKVENILKSDLNCGISENYERVLDEAVKENWRLNKFAQEIQNEFSFRIFVVFAFSAMSLCAMGFKVYTNPLHNINYVLWSGGKIQELLAFGEMGSIIFKTTDQLSSMYYESNWESVIARSSNYQKNVKLMKRVNMSITTNRKAFHLTGLNFFNVSLVTVLTVLRVAASYFTFLISLR